MKTFIIPFIFFIAFSIIFNSCSLKKTGNALSHGISSKINSISHVLVAELRDELSHSETKADPAKLIGPEASSILIKY